MTRNTNNGNRHNDDDISDGKEWLTIENTHDDNVYDNNDGNSYIILIAITTTMMNKTMAKTITMTMKITTTRAYREKEKGDAHIY